MITRHHTRGDAPSSAVYSDCLGYRYALTRVWERKGRRLLYIMLNPSKATEVDNDPTIERCERRARALGFGGFRATNLFAWRETDPARLKRAEAPIGPDNDSAIREGCAWADMVIASWGAHGDHMGRGRAVELVLRATGQEVHHLGLTKHGHPRHPLYISYDRQPEKWF